jgi:hypothetical protein
MHLTSRHASTLKLKINEKKTGRGRRALSARRPGPRPRGAELNPCPTDNSVEYCDPDNEGGGVGGILVPNYNVILRIVPGLDNPPYFCLNFGEK